MPFALSLTTWVSLFLLTSEISRAGLLGTPVVITSGVQPENWVHVADMDGSGRGSILYSPQPGVLHLLRQNQGSFAPAQVLISSGVARVRGVQTADFNGTGRLDLAVALELPDGSFAIRVLYGNSLGTYFALDPDYLLGGVPAQQAPLVLADLDRDGKMDILTSWRTSATGTAKGRVGWFRNLGGSDFAPLSSLFLAAFDAPCSLAVEDFNRDGTPDIAVADNARSEVRIFPGPDFVGSTSFATVSPPLRLIAENDGADKWPDLLVLSGGFDTLANQSIQNYTNTTGSFTGASSNLTNPASHSGGFIAADLNLDGRRDLIAVPDNNATRGLLVTINTGTGFVGPSYVSELASNALQAAVAFDEDHDGDPDLIAVSTGALLRFPNTFGHRLALARQQFRSSANNSAPQPLSSILAVDVNGDGREDAVTASSSDGSVRVYFNSGGQLVAGPVITTKPNVSYLACGDLDRDGDQDIVLQALNQNRVIWFQNNGTGSAWTEQVIPLAVSIPTGVAVGDINLDGHPDIVVGSGGSNCVHLLTNGGNGASWSISNVAAVANVAFVRIADVTRGGRPEIVVQRGDSGVVLLSYTNAWAATEVSAGVAGVTGLGLAVADLSGDGRADIAFGSGIAAWASIQQTGGSFAPREALGVGFHLENSVNADNIPRSIQIADLDRDGAGEVIATFRYSGMVFSRARPESGRQNASTPFLTNATVAPGDTAPLDLDGNGLPDLIRRDSPSSRMTADLTAAVHHNVSVSRLPAYGDASVPYNVLSTSYFGMLRINVQTYAWPGDGAVPLTGLRLTFLQHASPFSPLTGSAVANIFGTMDLYADLGVRGLFDTETDPSVTTIPTPAADATGTIDLPLPAASAAVAFGAPRGFFLATNTGVSIGWAIQATVPALTFAFPDSDPKGYAASVRMSHSGTAFHMRSQSPTTLQSWRFFHFNQPYNQGRAANEADFDQDGLPNLLEYCLGTNPKVATPSPIFGMDSFGSEYAFVFAAAAPGMPGGRLTLASSTNLIDWGTRASRSGAQAWTTNGLTVDGGSFDAERNTYLMTVTRKPAENFRLQADEIAP